MYLIEPVAVVAVSSSESGPGRQKASTLDARRRRRRRLCRGGSTVRTRSPDTARGPPSCACARRLDRRRRRFRAAHEGHRMLAACRAFGAAKRRAWLTERFAARARHAEGGALAVAKARSAPRALRVASGRAERRRRRQRTKCCHVSVARGRQGVVDFAASRGQSVAMDCSEGKVLP